MRESELPKIQKCFCLTTHTDVAILLVDIGQMLDPRLLGKISLTSVFYMIGKYFILDYSYHIKNAQRDARSRENEDVAYATALSARVSQAKLFLMG